ncbi:Uncharacterized [Syntrophomonas zehnderi OL-4]|uniref:Uncharacterized n=1 Tax=Syntrophomonas zehnderi OL-4 TaxID=690567 RepID=A0A0E4GC22_9FIRM|nr:hypothetical protein [Syntrophomonas zehnderi]CFY01390.1 Uncharacterized [Syntrophomonas zehnderi OL-4]
MVFPEPDVRVYYNELYSLLNLIKEEIQSQSHKYEVSGLEPDALEAYLLDINTYYYQSFHDRIFPLYKSQLENEIKALYRIGREEARLKEDIILNLKRVAIIYNRIKSGSKLLKSNRESINELLLASKRGRDQRTVELLYALKDLQLNLLGFANLLDGCLHHLNDRQLLNSLNEYPFQAAWHSLLRIWEPDNNRFVRDYKRFLINLELIIRLLVNLQQNDDPCLAANSNILKELEKLQAGLANKKTSTGLMNWYKQHLHNQLNLYFKLLNVYAEKNDRKNTLQTCKMCENWLQSLLYILEKSIPDSGNCKQVIFDLPELIEVQAEPAIKQLRDLSSHTAQSLQDLIKNLSESAQPSFENFYTSASLTLAKAQPGFKEVLESGHIPPGTFLAAELIRLYKQLSLFEEQLDFLQAKEEHAVRLKQQYEIMLENMDSYLQLLQDIKNELARTLAPRNIKRNFKDMDVRVEHIPINQGELFPARYIHLLDSSKIMGNESLEQDYIISEEDGDIFIFKLDELYEELIPHLLVTRKGS